MAPRSLGYLLFDTAVGCCGLAWGERGLTGVLLPEDGGPEATRRRMRRLHPQASEAATIAWPGAVNASAPGSARDPPTGGGAELPDPPDPSVPPLARHAAGRIRGLLLGDKDDLLDLPLDMSALPVFNRRVYEAVRRVGPGRTTTYGEIASLLGEPAAARAVGQAMARNPFAPVVPCHRVLAASGPSGGYGSGGFSAGGGVATKLRMLQMEGARLSREPGLFD